MKINKKASRLVSRNKTFWMLVAITIIFGLAIVTIIFNWKEKDRLLTQKSASVNVSVSEPKAKKTVSLPFAIKGQARVFESVVNIRIYEEGSQDIIYEDVAMANAPDARQFGKFEITIDYLLKRPATNKIIAETYWVSPKDGSQLDVVKIPLTLDLDNTQSISLFFTKNQTTDGADCAKVYPVARVIAQKDNVTDLLRETLALLLTGPKFVEQGEEYASALNYGLKIKDIDIRDNEATINFDKKISDGASCAEKSATAQIIKTATQFTSIKQVEILEAE